MSLPYRIWDLHAHLVGVPGRTPHERMHELLRIAAKWNIERVCVFMGMVFRQNPSPDEMRQQNDEVLEALSHYHDRAFGFCYVSGEHLEASLDEINRCVRDGPMVGIKFWVSRRCSDANVYAIVERAAELSAVIFQHTWWKTDGTQLPGESTPLDMVQLALRYPEIPMVAGHGGGTWEPSIRALRNVKNVSIETGGSDPTRGFVELAIRELGADRVIFGSDAGGRSFASQLAKVIAADIPETGKHAVLHHNLKKLLAPILLKKGIPV